MDVYHGKNKATIGINHLVRELFTTKKAVANDILKSGVNNDVDRCRYIFMDNRYAAPQLLAMVATTWSIRGVGTCKANRKGFAFDKSPMNNNTVRGSYYRLVDKSW